MLKAICVAVQKHQAEEFWFYSTEHGNALKIFEQGNDIIRTAHFLDIAKSDNLEGGDCDDRPERWL